MPRILVHFHLYYHEQVEFFLSKLKNINSVDWDLIVTYSEWNEESFKKIKSFKEDAKFEEVPNFGYDIWPFIKLMQDIDLDNYDYVIKLHTKRWVKRSRSNVVMLKGYEWRNALVDGLLYSPEYFREVVDRLENNPDIGMISSLLTYTSREWYGHKVDEELKRLGLSKRGEKLCRGSMFIMRTVPLKLLKTNLITEDLFRHDEPVSGSSFQNAHLYERLICHLPINLGYHHVASYPKKLTVWRVKVTKLLEPIGKFLFYCEKEGRPKKLVIRVLGLNVYKEK